MRGLDVEHRVERAVGNGQGERVALAKLQSVDLVASPAQFDSRARDVDPEHAPRAEVALDIGGAASAPAADLQHLSAAEIDPRGNPMIQIDRVAFLLVLGRQFRTGTRVLVPIAIVHERPVLGAPRIGAERTVEGSPQRRTQLRKAFDRPHESFYDHAPAPRRQNRVTFALACARREFNPVLRSFCRLPNNLRNPR